MSKSIRGDNSNKLWDRYLEGDKSTLIKLIEMYGDSLYIFLVNRTNSREVAKEVAQETWLKMVKHKGPIKNFKSYLFKVAANLWADMCNKNNKFKFAEISTSSFNGIGVNPDVLYKLGNEDITKIYKFCLTRSEEELWRLHCEGYSSEEISQQLPIEKKTIDNKKTIIRKKLIQAMKNLVND